MDPALQVKQLDQERPSDKSDSRFPTVPRRLGRKWCGCRIRCKLTFFLSPLAVVSSRRWAGTPHVGSSGVTEVVEGRQSFLVHRQLRWSLVAKTGPGFSRAWANWVPAQAHGTAGIDGTMLASPHGAVEWHDRFRRPGHLATWQPGFRDFSTSCPQPTSATKG